MMKPTPEYLAAPEVGRSRQDASCGAVRVIVENFSDSTNLFGKSMIYLSVDNGASFTLLEWKTSLLGRLKSLAREWPPHHVHLESLDDNGLHLSYFEATYDGPVDYKASYLFAEKQWELTEAK